MKRHKTYNHKYTKKYRSIKDIMDKRFNILIIIIMALMLLLFLNLFYLQVIRKDYYSKIVSDLNRNVIIGNTAPRGKIYDRNFKLIVDNLATKVITYNKPDKITIKREIELAYLVASMISVDQTKLNSYSLKDFWLKNNLEKGNDKITDSEWKLLKERKITMTDIDNLMRSRITDQDLSIYNDIDKEAAYIYYLMNVGYAYSEKVIKKNEVTEQEYATISENLHKIEGFSPKLDWDRQYLYDDIFKSVLGNVSTSETGLPLELKDHYLGLGYALNDRVGISGLEYQYESYLRGIKNTYVKNDSLLTLYKEGSRGNDLVLTIDIDLQVALESIVSAELLAAKQQRSTDYLKHAFVIIANPKTGEILAMTGKQVTNVNGAWQISDYTPGVYTSSVTPGSIVKGASQIVGYNTGALTIGEVRDDACIKIASTPIKCSLTYHGLVNDITALKYSSNTYQFNTAIKVGGAKYVYNQPLKINVKAFDTYRNTFAQFGLGVKTGIDLPNEKLGFKGNSTLPGYLLDLSIGQYDTYTPIQIMQYMSTIANGGSRMQPYLLKEVYDNHSQLVYAKTPVVLNTVTTEIKYLDRVKVGLREVMTSGGTGYNTIYPQYNPAGKTGTSESFADTNSDGKIDVETITHTFAGYAPYDNPKVVFTTIVPDIAKGDGNYISYFDRNITRRISQKFFEIYQ